MHSTGELAEVRCRGCAHGCGTTPPPRRSVAPRHRGRDGARCALTRRERTGAPARDGTREGERPRDEGDRRRVAVGSPQADVLLHRRDVAWISARSCVTSRRCSARASSSSRSACATKPSGSSGIGRCGREYCSAVVAAGPAAGEPRRRQGPEALAQPAADLRRLRAPHVLPALRARVLRAEPRRFPKEGQILVTARGEEKVIAATSSTIGSRCARPRATRAWSRWPSCARTSVVSASMSRRRYASSAIAVAGER